MQINEFVKLGGDQLVPYYADILGAILPCISDKEEKIRVVSGNIPIFLLCSCFFSLLCCLFLHCSYFFVFLLCPSFLLFYSSVFRFLVKQMKNFVEMRLIQLKDLM